MGNISVHINLSHLHDGLMNGSSFVTMEMWMNTGTNEWVETGAVSGYCDVPYATGCTSSGYESLSWFMADKRSTNGNYHEHYPTFGTSLSTDYPTGLHNHGGGTWIVQRSDHGGTAGWFTSTGNPTNAGLYGQAGSEIEYDTSAISGCAVESGLAYQVSGQTQQIPGWPNATLYNADNPPASVAWISQYNSISLNTNSGC